MGSLSALTSPVDYAYPNARVMALKSFMLKDEDLKALSSAKNLEEYSSLLEHTSYKQDVGKLTDMSLQSVETALLSNMASISRLAIGIAPKDTHDFLKAYMMVHEIEVVKLVLNRLDSVSKEKEPDYSAYLPALGPDVKNFLKEAPTAKTKKEAVDLLKDTDYDFLSKLSNEELATQGYAASMLDKYYYGNLWDSIDSLSSKDALYARKLVGTEIDAVNIMILLRSAACGCKAEKFLVSGGYRLGSRARGLSGKDVQEVSSALSGTAYKDVAAEGLKTYDKEKTLIRLELSLKKQVLAEYKRALNGIPFHIGVLLGFLKMKEYEVKNLRAIAVSVSNGMNQKETMDLVIT